MSFTKKNIKGNEGKEHAAPQCILKLKTINSIFLPQYLLQCNPGVVEITSSITVTTVDFFYYYIRHKFCDIYDTIKLFNVKITLLQSS